MERTIKHDDKNLCFPYDKTHSFSYTRNSIRSTCIVVEHVFIKNDLFLELKIYYYQLKYCMLPACKYYS